MAAQEGRFSPVAAGQGPNANAKSEYLLASAAPPDAAASVSAAAKDSDSGASFSFRDFLSVINPLQHIPIVGAIYRRLTGDTISAPAKIIGDTLFGGPLGFITSLADAAFTQATGKDMGAQALALVFPEKGEQRDPTDPQTQLMAAATPAAASPTAAAGVPPAPLAGDTVMAASEAAEPSPVSGLSAGAGPTQLSPARLFQRPAVAAPTGQNGKTLAQYQGFAGQRMPVIDATHNANGGPAGARSAPVPLQTTLPLVADRVRTPAAQTSPSPEMIAAQAASASGATTGDAQSGGDTGGDKNDWVSAEMLRGLDRYRDMKRQQENLPRQVDTAI